MDAYLSSPVFLVLDHPPCGLFGVGIFMLHLPQIGKIVIGNGLKRAYVNCTNPDPHFLIHFPLRSLLRRLTSLLHALGEYPFMVATMLAKQKLVFPESFPVNYSPRRLLLFRCPLCLCHKTIIIHRMTKQLALLILVILSFLTPLADTY